MAEFHQEDFHSLRVHIKKIKAIFSLTDACVNSFKQDKYFKTFKTVFQQAGKVRELQLQVSLMRKYKPDPVLTEYYHKLESDIQQEQHDFFSLINRKWKQKLEQNEKKILPLLEKVNARVVREFLFEKREQIENLFQIEKPKEGEIHELRKRIKELYYLEKIFQPKNKRLAIADDFQELLGLWHDYEVIRNDLLKDAQNHKLKPEEVKAIMAVQKKIANQADRLLSKIDFSKAMA